MKKIKDEKSSLFISTVTIFAALTAVSDLILESPLPFSGVWFSWVFMMEPLTGMLLDPYASFLATFIGVMVGHSIRYRGIYEFVFTSGAPFGAMISSLIFRGKWKQVLLYYIVLLSMYFLTPVSWTLPPFGMWDVYASFGCLVIAIIIINRKGELWHVKSSSSFYVPALCAFIGLEADVLFRIFLLIPCQTYWLFYGWNAETLQGIWAAGALETPTKAGLAALISAIIIPQITKTLRKTEF